MPVLSADPDMQQNSLSTGTYGYSSVNLNNLQSTEYTLVSLVVDTSGSVDPFRTDMEQCIKECVKACQKSPRADSLMLRLVIFDSRMQEVHGFKMLSQCNVNDYAGVLRSGGATALYDASENSISATTAYGKQLTDNEFSVNGVVIVITDGCDNNSKLPASAVKTALTTAVHSEALESLVSVLVGVNISDNFVSNALKTYKIDAGFTQYEEIKNANASSLAKLAAFISKSISSQSQALGSGGPSQPISLVI